MTIGHALARGEVSDDDFDEVFPAELRFLSAVHWTPIEVAVHAARLLAPLPSARVLDVGAGVGKACLIGALTTRAQWSGVERDPKLVATAFAAARQLGVLRRTRFRQGDASLVDWDDFDAFYFYNPLGSLLTSAMGLDPALRRPMFEMMARRLELRLAERPRGTRVVTYHGFGGEMPASYDLITQELIGTGHLRLWIKTRAS